MTYKEFEETFCGIISILHTASPIIASFIGSPLTGIIIGLLGAICPCDACDHDKMAQLLANDPDIYSKLQNLEKTHAKWLQSLS